MKTLLGVCCGDCLVGSFNITNIMYTYHIESRAINSENIYLDEIQTTLRIDQFIKVWDLIHSNDIFPENRKILKIVEVL